MRQDADQNGLTQFMPELRIWLLQTEQFLQFRQVT
jgi:hypothetical protein